MLCRDTLLVLAGVAALQTVASCVLYARTRAFYRSKFQHIERARRRASVSLD